MAAPDPPAGRVPLSFKGSSYFIPTAPLLRAGGRDGTGGTTHGLALLAWLSTEAWHTLLSLEAKER